MIIITHDLGVIAELAEKVVVMYAGTVVESGPVKEIFNAPCTPTPSADALDPAAARRTGTAGHHRRRAAPGAVRAHALPLRATLHQADRALCEGTPGR